MRSMKSTAMVIDQNMRPLRSSAVSGRRACLPEPERTPTCDLEPCQQKGQVE